MGLRDEQADILGGPILQRPESGVFATFSQYHLVFKSVTLFGLGLLVWIACVRGLEYLKKHRELRYRKTMRRKHGIPDSDCRPFAVAYAAAKRAHLEREAQDRKKTTNYLSGHNPPAVDQRPHAQKDVRVLRKRLHETTVHIHDYQLPVKHDIVYNNKRPEVYSPDFASQYDSHPARRAVVPEPSPAKQPSTRRASGREIAINLDNDEESRKRSLEDESDVEHETIKKSRMDPNELMDEDEQADLYTQYSDKSFQRASLGRRPEGNRLHMNRQKKSGGVDGLRNEDHEPDEAMEGIDEDEVTELEVVARGKKRDRAEAGSTFGGDDEGDARNGRASHHRKRRTISRRKIEPPARGQKRDREIESPESEPEPSGGRPQRSSKKRRGKKAASDEVGEISVEDPRVSKDPLCGGRKIGDRWEADGVQYKVGEKGERLRLALVKKARSKYHMPQDSQHPDRSAALEIYVETWMTEEQYNQAEVRQELVWQEASGESSGPKTPDAFNLSMKNGKNLLWDSVKFSTARRPFRQFIPPGASTRVNPFVQWQSQPMLGRRVASSSIIASPVLPGVADSPGFRGFSKWEKQDREAEAMSRIRAKIEEQRKTQTPPPRSTEIRTSVTAPELGAKPLSVPTITVTPALAVAAEGKSDDGTSQSKSSVPTFPFAVPPSTSDSVKGSASAASTTAPAFSPASTSGPAVAPSTLFPSTASTTPSTASLSPFSFGKPSQAPLSIPPTASSSTMPSIFGRGIDAGTPSPSKLGAATQPQPPESASKPVPFSFAKPDVSSSSPAVVTPSTTKPQAAPTFNITPGSSSSPVTFTFTPAATKTQSPTPVPVAVSTSENPKPTTPLFSFSGASLSPSTAAVPTSSAPSAPRFSFGQPPTTLAPTPGSDQAPNTAPQPKPTLKFGQTLQSATEGATAVAAVNESKNPAMPMSTFGTATGSTGLAKSSPFGVTSAFGSTTFTSASASPTHLFGQPAFVGNNSPTPAPPKAPLAPASTSTSDGTISSTPAGASASGSAPVFSFGGINSDSKSTEGSKPAPLFSGTAGGSGSAESKPTFTFGVSANAAKPTSIFGGGMENLKPPSVFGNSGGPKQMFASSSSVEAPKPAAMFGGAEGPKSTFSFSDDKVTPRLTAENHAPSFITTSDDLKLSNSTDPSKPTPTPGGTTFGASSSTSPFAFGKKDGVTTHTPSSTSAQTKPATSFAFGASSGATGSIFGQPSAFTASGDSSQSVFGKSAGTIPSAFGFAGSSSSSGAFTFGKPATQNQKQEQ